MLTADIAFMAILFFNMLRYSIGQLPQILTNGIKSLISLRRILAFLNEDEQKNSHINRNNINDVENVGMYKFFLFKCFLTNFLQNYYKYFGIASKFLIFKFSSILASY